MDKPFTFKLLIGSTFILLFPVITLAYVSPEKTIAGNSVSYQEQDPKKEKMETKQVPDKPDIGKVPKARKQSRPPVVVKPNIKPKPVKIIRPKIKKP